MEFKTGIKTKICGINSAESLEAAISGGAAAVGFVFFPASPRYVNIEAASELVAKVPKDVLRVGLTVNMEDRDLTEIVDNLALDLLQLHGDESPKRTLEIKELSGLPIIKAIKIASPGDIGKAVPYIGLVEQILFDSMPPEDMKRALPGGNAVSFDWNWLGDQNLTYPWMLSGGLNAKNVETAVKTTGASFIDVSSGVEDRPGFKDPVMIKEFLDVVGQIEK